MVEWSQLTSFRLLAHTSGYGLYGKQQQVLSMGLLFTSVSGIDFLVIICHVTPQDVAGEIDLLIEVYEWAKAKYGVEVLDVGIFKIYQILLVSIVLGAHAEALFETE